MEREDIIFAKGYKKAMEDNDIDKLKVLVCKKEEQVRLALTIIKEYVDHKPNCELVIGGDMGSKLKCTCGLDDALKQVKE